MAAGIGDAAIGTAPKVGGAAVPGLTGATGRTGLAAPSGAGFAPIPGVTSGGTVGAGAPSGGVSGSALTGGVSGSGGGVF
ncbi:hypothetical protein [Mycobacterium ulcerans]|uniref:hypothetical protein n=1 Tax=Mycobacterium ulcerans TaxID=1809 RepID=UPI003B969C8C